MTDTAETIDYSKTLYLPQTDFPMRAGLPEKEPVLVKRWQDMDLYKRLREDAAGRPKYVLHDGPPYANGNIHIGHALNKVLKDVITRSFQMRGNDSNYVPGWDCHGLPIEWKIEEENYRSKGKSKPDLSDPAAMIEFRQECRRYAEHWIKVQGDEFQRLGVVGDFHNPYLTMSYHAEARIAGELLKFAMSGQLYRGSKPVMWSVVERTALAEAEIEYHDYESDTIWVKFPVASTGGISGEEGDRVIKERMRASVVIWTTTPWTIPGNRAVAYSPRVNYGLYEVGEVQNDFGPRPGELLIFADALAEDAATRAKLSLNRLRDVTTEELDNTTLSHPFKGLGGGYDFAVPMLPGDHVTDDAGTGFVHTAPGHGREDFDVWVEYAKREEKLINVASKLEDGTFNKEWQAKELAKLAIPFTVDDGGYLTKDAPGFGPDREGGAVRVIDDNGKKGDANQAVIDELIKRNALFARGRLKHQYPHSWRSKKPIIFRNTPQWFVYMDRRLSDERIDLTGKHITDGSKYLVTDTLRSRALAAIDDTRFVPAAGQTRLRAMIEERPDWVLSRQRAWGVPIAVFADADGNVLKDEAVNQRIVDAFETEGADAWFAEGARERFLGSRTNEPWLMVKDILDVWFDSGSTHTFTLEDRPDLKWPADVYLEGSDQHRGWFHSSLLESCGTRGRAPYNAVITHGFTMDEEGRKMSKSLGNTVVPQDVIKQSGADILRLWVVTTDYWEDQRLGKTILQTNIDAYRKLRNTIRWMLGTLAHDDGAEVPIAEMPELERLMLHRLAELDALVRTGYDAFEFKRITRALLDFMVVELSAFYFDIRKDALYCDGPSSVKRKASVQVVRHLFDCLVKWLAPMLPFTTEEAWLERNPDARSLHLEQMPTVPAEWRDDKLAEKWRKVRQVRSVVTGALELERARKTIGSSLEAVPVVYMTDAALEDALSGVDLSEICITSDLVISHDSVPPENFSLREAPGVAVVIEKAEDRGLRKCARSWRYTADVGSDPAFPDVSARDAEVLHELKSLGRL
ncbi:isoleucine--tRNA ligase [Mesorhizobium sp. BE184]|uniref:isoleucine--tRNA ligase n=1 Tax=Mesorhizobium sp. BE184 TaxID=2817714 RepID=UPI00285AC9B5|nr:isoleucine--tRNA ligase [Mesorhizobium sp. BE184]MDR7032700.1 isoleucyl-tRNA synthetase [Mesorhizobium sp. BE184]